MSMKLCINCKHYEVNPRSANAQDGLCKLVEAAKSPVDGQPIGHTFVYASIVRTMAVCDIQGRAFERKESWHD